MRLLYLVLTEGCSGDLDLVAEAMRLPALDQALANETVDQAHDGRRARTSRRYTPVRWR